MVPTSPQPTAPTTNKETHGAPGRAHSPCRRRASTRPRSHGPQGLGAAGTSEPVSQVGDPTASAVPPARHPTLLPRHRRLGLTAPAPSRSPRAHPPPGRNAGRRRPARRRTSAASIEASVSLLFLLSWFPMAEYFCQETQQCLH
ncbi:PREDICTED: translation initiation factor IF-2-like [Rhinopithecus bieti]|uniref:translation initiation factor IF-2-like n=1 Tax=Rhinopithecus bieti TaxID=61621 RepID=UPI00083BCD5D|nr:PREDICTED: translation initiation factor IF-2-like [Rhinopithecus bieti]